jgi:hypothetical protein
MSVHVCTICEKSAEWSPAWTWYGSYRQLDDGEPVVKLCSAACKAEFSKRRKQATIAKFQARREAAQLMHGRRP